MGMKRFLALAAALLLILGPVPTAFAFEEEEAVIPTQAQVDQEVKFAASLTPGENLPVRSAILMEQQSGKILYAQNEHEALPPASVTKIMSLLLIMEAIDSGKIDLTDTVTCSETAANYGGSQIWLKPGEEMTVEDLLKAAAISSANDATVCLAEYVAGSEAAFVNLMNQRAQDLGMNDTVFKCAAGLDNEGHVSSAYDIALMSRALLEHPLITKYTTIWMDSLRDGATQLVNTNRMVRFYEGATGLKTGTTNGAGSCLSATATRDGLGLIAVVMGAPTSDDRFAASRSLLDWGFANFMLVELKAPEAILPMKVTGGTAPQVELWCQPPAGVVVDKAKGSAVTQEVVMEESVAAPVENGQQLGKVVVLVDGEQVAEYPLLASQEVRQISFFRALGLLYKRLLAVS